MFNTFLSCDTRANNVCLNRTEGVPQVVSPLLKDPSEIQRRIGCGTQEPPKPVATRATASPPAAVPKPAGKPAASAVAAKKEAFGDVIPYMGQEDFAQDEDSEGEEFEDMPTATAEEPDDRIYLS
jgi:hypothetical protein